MRVNEIKSKIMIHILDKLRRIGIREDEIGDQFDLVNTGLVNSLEFVDLVAKLEKEYKCEIDYEVALEKGELTTLGGLARTFENCING